MKWQGIPILRRTFPVGDALAVWKEGANMRKRITSERRSEAWLFVLGAFLSVVFVAAVTAGVTDLEPKQTASISQQQAARWAIIW
jgi:hypothetical protein